MEKEEMTDYLIGNQEEMYQWAYRLTRNYDDAQDLLQSTLLCALKSVGMYTEENNISGWLYTIMRNIFSILPVIQDDAAVWRKKISNV